MQVLGFLFAFHCVQGKRFSALERVVSFLSDSPVVHVEMLPVYRRAGGRGVWVHEAYTAFMGRRFGCYEPNVLDQEETRFLFLPTPPEVGSHGMRFLDSLLGLSYNYVGLPRTLMPEGCRRAADWEHPPHSIFCSEAGLQLACMCDSLGLPRSFECTPAELYRRLALHSSVLALERHEIVVLS